MGFQGQELHVVPKSCLTFWSIYVASKVHVLPRNDRILCF